MYKKSLNFDFTGHNQVKMSNSSASIVTLNLPIFIWLQGDADSNESAMSKKEKLKNKLLYQSLLALKHTFIEELTESRQTP
jgi:hypothetical protein